MISILSVCLYNKPIDRCEELEKFIDAHGSSIAHDLDGAPVFLAPSAFTLNYEHERWPAISIADVKDYQMRDDAA